jgi:hypothetical protein
MRYESREREEVLAFVLCMWTLVALNDHPKLNIAKKRRLGECTQSGTDAQHSTFNINRRELWDITIIRGDIIRHLLKR